MKKRIQKVLFIIGIFFAFLFFYFQNQTNYHKIHDIKFEKVEHPELLPNKDIVKFSSFGFANFNADLYWLEAIQYIGSNAIGSEYKKYLYTMIDLITELNPYFDKPYLIGQLLLPAYNFRYENLTDEEQMKTIIQGEKIGLKGIKNFCPDEKKIQMIREENNLEKITTEEKYKNPCKTDDIPFSQAYIYYYYLKNAPESAQFYKIASANEDSLEGAKIMSAIMSGKSGSREISIMMFVTLAQNMLSQKKDEVCTSFLNTLKNLSAQTFQKNIPLAGKDIQKLDEIRKSYYDFNEETETDLVLNTGCENYVNKAMREFNLAYLDQENKRYFKNNGKNAKNAKELFDKGYIDFMPVDFQQYETYGIIYEFNDEIGNFDYKMGNY